MLVKLGIFAIGYLLGSRAGRARYEAIVAGARDLARGEEVATVVGLVRGAIWILSQRGRYRPD
jgi:preprotein translocase subunit YajC